MIASEKTHLHQWQIVPPEEYETCSMSASISFFFSSSKGFRCFGVLWNGALYTTWSSCWNAENLILLYKGGASTDEGQRTERCIE